MAQSSAPPAATRQWPAAAEKHVIPSGADAERAAESRNRAHPGREAPFREELDSSTARLRRSARNDSYSDAEPVKSASTSPADRVATGAPLKSRGLRVTRKWAPIRRHAATCTASS